MFLVVFPPELRNNVYELVLQLDPDSDGKVELVLWKELRTKHSRVSRRWSRSAGRWVRNSRYRVDALSTCKQIFSEACGIFYFQNHFKISGDDEGLPVSPLGSYLRVLRPERSVQTKSFTITVKDFKQAVAALEAMKQFKSLEELGIIVEADAPVDRMTENVGAFAKALKQLSGMKSFSLVSSSVEEEGDDALDALGLLNPESDVVVELN